MLGNLAPRSARMPGETYEPMPVPTIPYAIRRRRAWVRAFWIACGVVAVTLAMMGLAYWLSPVAAMVVSIVSQD